MGYSALCQMREKNNRQYGIKDSVFVPPIPQVSRRYGQCALAFLRDCCEDLKFDPARAGLSDSDGRSARPNQIPYNMERDLDRLCLETAAARFSVPGTDIKLLFRELAREELIETGNWFSCCRENKPTFDV